MKTKMIKQRANNKQQTTGFYAAPDTQDILNITTVIHVPAQLYNFIRTDDKNFPKTTRDDII